LTFHPLFNKDRKFLITSSSYSCQALFISNFISCSYLPDTIFPRYCHGLFPESDRIIDFMNLGFEKVDKIIENSCWYPVEEVELEK